MLNHLLIDRVGMHNHLGLRLKPDLCCDTHLSNIRKQVNLKFLILYRVKDQERKIIYIMYVFGPSLLLQTSCNTQEVTVHS